MRNVLPHLHLRNLAFVVYALLLAAPHLGAQETSGAQETNDIPPDQVRTAPEQRPTLLLYSQHRLPEELWAALFTALRANLPEIAAKVPANEANPEFVRGDNPANGDLAGKTITVYLSGDCRPSAQRAPFPWRARLGWVNQVNGYIVPIIHVECTKIGEGISGQTQWMNRNQRTTAMSEAIAQVVLHEWVHVATQSAAHGSEGVTKAEFGVDDMLCGDRTRSCGLALR